MEKLIRSKVITLVIFLCLLVVFLAGCNRQVIDLTYNFNYGQVRLSDGTVVEGKVQSWKDFANGDTVQVRIDGKTYLVHHMNATLIAE